MVRYMTLLFLIAACVCASVRAAEPGSSLVLRPPPAAIPLSGNARVDFVGFRELAGGYGLAQDSVFFSTAQAQQPSAKSPWLAGGLSIVLPGAGEFYAESYWKSAAFFVAEVVLWTVAYSYDKKGDRQLC